MKKLITIILTLTIFISVSVEAKEANSIYVDNKMISDYMTVSNEKGEQLYPFRLIMESIGASVAWKPEARATVLRYKGCGYLCYLESGCFYVKKYDYCDQAYILSTVIEGSGQLIEDRIYLDKASLIELMKTINCEFSEDDDSIRATSTPFSSLTYRDERRAEAREIHVNILNDHRAEFENLITTLMAISENQATRIYIARNYGWGRLVSYANSGGDRQAKSFPLNEEETEKLNAFFRICDIDAAIEVSCDQSEKSLSVSLYSANFISTLRWCAEDSLANFTSNDCYIEDLGNGWVYCESFEVG